MAKPNKQSLRVLTNAGKFGQHVEEKEWNTTPLGDMDQWPDTLKIAFGVILNSRVPNLICWGDDLICLYNKAYFENLIMGEGQPEVLGKPLKTAIPMLWKKLRNPIKGILNGEIESWDSVPGGNDLTGNNWERITQYTCNPIYNSHGTAEGLLIQVLDQKNNLPGRLLTTKDSQLHQPLTAAPVGILMLSGNDFKINAVNSTFLQLTGNNEENLINKPLLEIYPSAKQQFLPILQSVLQSGKSFYGDEILVPISFEKKERNFYLNVVLHPVRSDNSVIDSIRAVIIDVTNIASQKHQLLEKEKHFKKLVKESRICILLLNGPDMVIEYGNDLLFTSIFKINPENAIGKPFFELFPEMNHQKFSRRLQSVLITGATIHEKESSTLVYTPEGSKQYFFDFEFSALKDDYGNVTGILVNFYDVTEIVASRSKQKESQIQLELSLDAGGLALWEMELPSQKLTYSSKLAKILGIDSIEDSTGSIRKFIHPDDQENIMTVFTTAMKTGKYFFEGRVQRPDKSVRWVRVRGKVFYDANRQPIKLFGSTRDITVDRKKNEELQRKEYRLRHLILQAPIAIGILRGPDYKVEIINDVAEQLLGKTREQLLGKPILEVMTEVDIPIAKKLLDQVYYKEQAFSATEYPVKFLRNGRMEKIYVHFEYDPLKNSQGKTIGIIVVGIDVTSRVLARKKIEESETRFRLLANTGPYFVWSTDESGNIIFVNETMQRFTGLTYEELTSAGFHTLLHPDDILKSETKWTKALQTGTEYIDEQRLRRTDGTYHWYLTRAIPQRESSGKAYGWIATSTDIGEIKEQELQKDFFISRASHELKTPITSLKGYIQILQSINQESTDNMLVNSLQRMNLMVDKLTRLIDDLLDSTRISNQQLLINKQPFNLCSLIYDVIDEVKPLSEYEILFNDKDCNVNIMGDKEKLGQVMTNLLTNAIKYSPNVQTVWIDAETDNDSIKIAVIDHGIGINKLSQEKIFEKFYRVSGNNVETFPGFGIGLFIANEILKLHGSKLYVNSETGKGSTFYFYLKIRQELGAFPNVTV